MCSIVRYRTLFYIDACVKFGVHDYFFWYFRQGTPQLQTATSLDQLTGLAQKCFQIHSHLVMGNLNTQTSAISMDLAISQRLMPLAPHLYHATEMA